MPVAFLVFLAFLASSTAEECANTRNRLNKLGVTYRWNWTVRDKGEGNITPILTISWSIDPNTATKYDGWFYRLEDLNAPDGNDESYDYDEYDYDDEIEEEDGYDELNCTRLLGQSWKHENLTKEEINVTCHERCYERRSCSYNNYCMRLQEERCIRVSKKKTSLELHLDFGVEYDFRSYATHNYTLSDIIGNEVIEPIFCINYYVKGGLSEQEARQICKGATSGFDYGPVYNFTTEFSFNLTNDDVTVTISWKRPLDIKPGAKLISIYGICDVYEGKIIEVKQANDNETDFFYQYNMTGKQGGEKIVSILPNAEKCSKHFARHNIKFPVINKCNTTVTQSYCDEHANCNNEYEGEGKCECYSGYDSGNGVNKVWSGTGCKMTCASKEDVNNHTCHEYATCANTTEGVNCFCPEGYTGDGLRLGRGCSNNVFIIALPILGIFFILFVLAGIYVVLRRRKRRRRRNRFVQLIAHRHEGHLMSEKYCSKLFGSLELDADDITLQDVIGRGAFAVVHKGTLKIDEENAVTVAVKIAQGLSPRNEFLAEIGLLQSIGKHENILGVLGCVTKDKTMLVTEYMKYGDLLSFLYRARNIEKLTEDDIYKLTEEEIYRIGRQVANGMEYLVEIKVIHGDLAARNVLIGEGLQAKISDFGLANDIYCYGVIKDRTERKLPYKWASPERMMEGKVPITWRSDVWSFGVLMYEAVTLGDAPFPKIPQEQLCEKLMEGYRMDKPDECTIYLYKLMRQCWEWVPSKRPTFRDLQERLVPQKEDLPYTLLSAELKIF